MGEVRTCVIEPKFEQKSIQNVFRKGFVIMQKFAVMGHGVVGSGVVELFYKNKDSIITRSGDEMDLKYILDIRDFPDLEYCDKFTKDFEQILNDPEVTVVAEVMGGLNPAYDYTKRLLLAGKSVVTSNKELVAAKGAELLGIAKEKNVSYLYEASVGGGIPIIRPISQCLAANDINEILGILNGTTNFIMTKMIREGMSFDDALALAQSLGYAERNPSADVDGHDACRKICILASLAFGKHVYPAQVHTEGITKITGEDVSYAGAADSVIKLIGRVKKQDDGRIQCSVGPVVLSKDSQLSSVDDVFNAIMVRGDATGDVMFYGKGAGKLPTASAVMADIIDCVKHIDGRKFVKWEEGSPEYVVDYLEDTVSLYVRAKTANNAEAEEAINKVLGKVKYITFEGAPAHEIVFITPVGVEKDIRGAIKSISSIIEPINVLRVCE